MQEKAFFGTDGIRGKVGETPITADFALKLGWAIGQALKENGHTTPSVLIGKDTRISGYMLESALEAGLSAAGCHVLLVGPIPTPGIAYLTQTQSADLGIVISASHNNFLDNGIKLFSGQGLKIGVKNELLIESFLEQPITTSNAATLGKASRIADASGRYIEFCKSTIPHYSSLNPLKIVVDCANGAAYKTAPLVFRELGADVIAINHTPNGLNINHHCGSMHPEAVRKTVLKEKADIGIALDGDGDRVIMVDHLGDILDGDDILAVILTGLLKTERFSGGLIGTDMTNIGLEQWLKKINIPFERASVGDQYVLERLLKNQWILGGEPSGHIIYLPVSTTADGTVAALQVLHTIIQSQTSLHELKKCFQKLPQCAGNIRYEKNNLDPKTLPTLHWTTHFQTMLGNDGRVIIRPSGTEPVIRFMLEHNDVILMEKISEEIKRYIEAEIRHID